MASPKPKRRTMTTEASTAVPSGLARSLSWLRANLHEPIDLEQLARIAGVPPCTLERHFRTFLNTTPLAWVRRMRLTPRHLAFIGPRLQS